MNNAVASRSNNHGVTLIECLCVLVIIGILLALAIPSLRQARVEARRLLCISNAAQVNKLVLLYTGENKGS
ncbi:MAG: type II secretion system protein, partial [Phycisphaerae bacterium]